MAVYKLVRSKDMGNFCSKCGNKIESNESFCSNCGNQLNFNNVNNQTKKKKIGYGKCLGFTILVALGIGFIGWLVGMITALAGNRLELPFLMFGLPILGIVFSPIIALIVYLIKNK